jgi:ADP-ribose pyrophosphatase
MSREIYRGRLIRLNRESVSLPNGNDVELDIVHHPGGAVVAALDEDDNVCMLRQFRHAAGGVIWELPAGCIDPDDTEPIATARRELEEEAGLRARDWQSLGSIYTTPGFCDEVLYLYLARGLEGTRTDHGDDEQIEVHWLALADAMRMVADNEIRDGKTVAGLFKARARLAG